VTDAVPGTGRAPAPRLRVAAAFAIVYVVWGSTYLAIKFAIDTIPPFLMAGSRFALAGALLYIYTARTLAPAPTPRQWWNAASVGVLLLALGTGGVVWAEQRVPSGLTALVVAAMPIWLVTFEAIRPRGRRPSALAVAGIVIGLVGQAILARAPAAPGGHATVSLVGLAVLLGATMSWAAGSLRARLVDLPASRLRTTAIEMLAGGAALLLAGAIDGEWAAFDPARLSAASVAAWLYLIVFGSLVAFTAFVWLNETVAPARVATYAYVNPVVAVALGWAFLGEPITARTVVAAVVILGAVLVINLAGASASRAAAGRVRRSAPPTRWSRSRRLASAAPRPAARCRWYRRRPARPPASPR
jgi:drug/metabolite transporter (DMT)-like permease